MTAPSIILNDKPLDWVLTWALNYAFTDTNTYNIPDNFLSYIDINQTWATFSMSEVYNKCSIDSLSDLNYYLYNLSKSYQQLNWKEKYEDLIFNSHSDDYKKESLKELKDNWINISKEVSEEVENPTFNVFEDKFTWDNDDLLIWEHTPDSYWTWNLTEGWSTWSYMIHWNSLRKDWNWSVKINPIPLIPISTQDYSFSFKVSDFAWWDIYSYIKYIDSNNNIWLKINLNWYELFKTVLWAVSSYSIDARDIDVDDIITLSVGLDNISLSINYVEVEYWVDDPINNIWKPVIDLINNNAEIDNFKIEYK